MDPDRESRSHDICTRSLSLHTRLVRLSTVLKADAAMATSLEPLPRRIKHLTDLCRSTMNRFRTKKKAAPQPLTQTAISASNDEALAALSAGPSTMSSASLPPQIPSPTTQLKKSGTSRWKKQKKPVEVAPALDLSSALPSTDDFRTSLLMPNLSARFSMLRDGEPGLSTRFSMLREQDDPRSMLGKASDDSVLQPRRKSRMDFGGLGDIAEDVASIKSQKVRPPFAFERQDSFQSEEGYASENGSNPESMMSRARPGEGNIMFGGRQKVYMIPKAGSSSTRSLGKQVYEDDIGMSAFQKYRKERELAMGRSSDESQSFDFGLDQSIGGAHDDHVPTHDDTGRDLAHSPSLSSSERKRSTNSTSHSEARSSTAATSVASQPATAAASPAVAPIQPPAAVPSMQSHLKRADTKTRRLYEHGLDQHMQEQQTSALSRLNSIQRQRTMTNGKQSPPVLHSTKSASNLHDKARPPVYALRAQSPETVSPPTSAFGMRKPVPNNASPMTSGPVSPATPMDFDDHGALNLALEPGDRGKATAMGAFNKPRQAYDDQQYMERQRQLQRTASNAATKPSGPSAFQQRMGQFEQERGRSDSNASARSGSSPAPEQSKPSPYSVFQRAAQMNTQPAVQQFDKSSLPDTHRTFFGNISASDSEEEEEDQARFNPHPYQSSDYGYGGHHGRWQPRALQPVSEHPALRGHRSKPSLAEEDEDVEPMAPLNTNASVSPVKDTTAQPTIDVDVDSPTLGPGASATPLNGLMQHLRQQSNVSSNFANDDRPSLSENRESQTWNPKNLDLVYPPLRNTIDSDSPYASSNPFDLEEMSTFPGSEKADGRASPISPIDNPRPSAQFESRAGSRSTFLNRQSAVSDLTPEAEVEAEPSWQTELQKQHTRDPSTATQDEREAFARELAARQNAIREKMKSTVDSHSRETSPAPTGPRKAFGMLRSKPSGESIENVPRAQAPPKAMKMLGLNGPPPSASSNTLVHPAERGGYSLDIGRPYEDYAPGVAPRAPMPNPQARALQQSDQDIRQEWQQSRSRENSESRPVRPSPGSSAGTRSRANSAAATGGRSRSRTGPYRDDLEKAMIEGTGSSASVVPDLSPMVPRELTPRPSPDVMQSQFDPPRSRARSSSRGGGMSGYFDQKSLQPLQTGSRDRLAPGAPSPAQLSPNVYSPAASISGRPSPTIPAYAQNMTPPLSGTNTPLSATFQPPPQIPPSSGRPNGVLRKKTISKGDISEPTLVSSTSTVDTIDLPEGASLKNGMDEPPPVPPINPRRRVGKGLFGLGHRKESDDSIPSHGSRSKTPDMLSSRPYTEVDFPLETPRAPRSQTQSPRMPKQSFDQMRSATMPQMSTGSPERERVRSPVPPVPVEGGMF